MDKKELRRQIREQNAVLNTRAQENLSGMRVVKAFVRERYEEEKFSKASDNVRGDFLKADRILAFNAPLMQICSKTSLISMVPKKLDMFCSINNL